MEIESKYAVPDCSSDLSQRLNFFFYEIIYEWANQKSFHEIIQLNTIDEGMIIKMVTAVEKTCDHIKCAAKVIGNSVLSQKMDDAKLLLKRGIIFTPSLYLE